MNPAYRIPLGKFPIVARFTSQETAANTPITEMVVNSLITSHADGANGERRHRGRRHRLGRRLRHPRWSSARPTAARPGRSATLGDDLGKYAFRTWSFPLTGKGKVTVMARASNAIGQTQTATLIHNPAGYHHNVIHSVSLNVA